MTEGLSVDKLVTEPHVERSIRRLVDLVSRLIATFVGALRPWSMYRRDRADLAPPFLYLFVATFAATVALSTFETPWESSFSKIIAQLPEVSVLDIIFRSLPGAICAAVLATRIGRIMKPAAGTLDLAAGVAYVGGSQLAYFSFLWFAVSAVVPKAGTSTNTWLLFMFVLFVFPLAHAVCWTQQLPATATRRDRLTTLLGIVCFVALNPVIAFFSATVPVWFRGLQQESRREEAFGSLIPARIMDASETAASNVEVMVALRNPGKFTYTLERGVECHVVSPFREMPLESGPSATSIFPCSIGVWSAGIMPHMVLRPRELAWFKVVAQSPFRRPGTHALQFKFPTMGAIGDSEEFNGTLETVQICVESTRSSVTQCTP